MGSVEFSLFLVKNSLIDKADDKFKTIMQWSDVDLFRRPLNFLFPADASDRLDRLLDHDSNTLTNVRFPRVPLRVKTGGYINFDMKMAQTGPDERRLDFYKPNREPGGPSTTPNEPAADMESFFTFVEELLASPFNEDIELTMVSVDALKEESSLSQDDRNTARESIEEKLQSKAVGGKLGKLDDASYGLVTSGGWDEEAFDREMAVVAEKLNLAPALLAAKSANIDLDDRTLPSDKLHQALNHSKNVFLGEVEQTEELNKLSDVVDGIEHNRNLILDALKRYSYRVSSRTIFDTKASSMLAQLQQGKVNLEGHIRSPDEILVMADHPDLSIKHDLAQLEDLIRMRVRRPESDRLKPDFYELCRSTLIQEEFLTELRATLTKHGEKAQNIGFRIKGMPPVKHAGLHWEALNKISAEGHPVWIDRFGDVVVAPEALNCLKSGYIEIPTPLLRKLSEHNDGSTLLTQLIATWRKLYVGVISADLNDQLKIYSQELGITIALED